eukprot:TRINITY_DN1672_c0_g1_i1.p1 TRINITY_DN1672_c0_g1~~TRINITY_DN1672_c0_g1_i1.p1  ORF type:complete len:459 (+),score=83.22 TRINITY_DN1672_c0_g1_i1:55-1431(+)
MSESWEAFTARHYHQLSNEILDDKECREIYDDTMKYIQSLDKQIELSEKKRYFAEKMDMLSKSKKVRYRPSIIKQKCEFFCKIIVRTTEYNDANEFLNEFYVLLRYILQEFSNINNPIFNLHHTDDEDIIDINYKSIQEMYNYINMFLNQNLANQPKYESVYQAIANKSIFANETDANDFVSECMSVYEVLSEARLIWAYFTLHEAKDFIKELNITLRRRYEGLFDEITKRKVPLTLSDILFTDGLSTPSYMHFSQKVINEYTRRKNLRIVNVLGRLRGYLEKCRSITAELIKIRESLLMNYQKRTGYDPQIIRILSKSIEKELVTQGGNQEELRTHIAKLVDYHQNVFAPLISNIPIIADVVCYRMGQSFDQIRNNFSQIISAQNPPVEFIAALREISQYFSSRLDYCALDQGDIPKFKILQNLEKFVEEDSQNKYFLEIPRQFIESAIGDEDNIYL